MLRRQPAEGQKGGATVNSKSSNFLGDNKSVAYGQELGMMPNCRRNDNKKAPRVYEDRPTAEYLI